MSVVEVINSDSSDNDIFVLKQIKPVNKITLQKALIIKHKVLTSLSSKKKKKKKKKEDNSSKKKTPDKSQSSLDVYCGSAQKDHNNANKAGQHNVNGKKLFSDTPVKMEVEGSSQDHSIDSIDERINQSDILKDQMITDKKRFFQISDGFSKITDSNEKKSKVQKTKNKDVHNYTKNHTKELLNNHSNPTKNTTVVLNENNEFFQSNQNSIMESDVELPNVNNIISKVKLEKEELCSDYFQTDFSVRELDESKYRDNSALNCLLLKKMIHEETQKQMFLEQSCLESGKKMEKLLSSSDVDIFAKFYNMNENACKLYVRMLCRKKDWHRVSDINYKDISCDLTTAFAILSQEKFVDTNIEDQELRTQLELLSKPEVMTLCRTFNVFFKTGKPLKKECLIEALEKQCKNQKSPLEMLKMQNSKCRLSLLKTEIKKCLGMCVKLNEKTYNTFYKILLLFSFPHYFDEEDKRFGNELYTYLRVYKNFLKFPTYELSPTVVFETQSDLEKYKESLLISNQFDISITNKNHEEFISIVNVVKQEFKNLLLDSEYIKRYLNLPTFLRKFSAGAVYARILSKFCQTFKKLTKNTEIKDVIELLLDKNVFLPRKRGGWYEILVKVLETLKQNTAAAEVIVKALNDDYVNEVQKLTLQIKGQALLKKKNSGIYDQLKETLNNICTVLVQQPHSIEINGKAIDQNLPGCKGVYVQDTGQEKVYMSVEEMALNHYKRLNFTKGVHAEGFIVKNLYYLLFFDIIYGPSPVGAFQSTYQDAPLDFNGSTFYESRKEAIDKLLNDLLKWDDLTIETTIRDTYFKNYNISCLISWEENFTPELYCEIIRCITMPILVQIFLKFVKNFRVYRSGFPDLTVWNPDTNQIKFVEVKSPNDRLSPAQRIWLDYLRKIGLDCEVCNVRNTSAKSLK